ncbi:motility protein A [Clostridium vincentii]|uniref:Chemotaxis protein PomA n=1 Tax=Clostridium vincentii TaxID=52704 RepID=A0A2T0BJH0_9CLOT|nr:motility protein A [Clostridium vincentii]PRR83973.1 Chemotaxis protein PomA [Clostridium vincentii]
MKKSDALTTIGLAGGIIVLLYAMMMGGQGLLMFWDISSLLITVGGSLAAVMITLPISTFKKIGVVFMQSFKQKQSSGTEIVSQFSDLSKKARKEGLLSLEDEIAQLKDDFLKKGLQMVVDGIEPETIKEILELEIGEMENRHSKGYSIFSVWGNYAPGFGMLGTLIGLIQMLSNLTDASTIAQGMGKALITTFYGSLLANIFCNPISSNLSRKSEVESGLREMMLEGILAIQSGVNPRIIEEKLMTYLAPTERLEYLNKNTEDSEGVV